MYNESRYVGVVYLTVSCDHPYLFSFFTFRCFAIPTSCICNVFYHLFMLVSSSRYMPELRFAITQQVSPHRLHIQASYTSSIGWRVADPSIHSNTQANPSLDGWQSQLSLSQKTGGTHRSRHSKSIDNTSLISFIHSFRYYIHIFKWLVQLITQCIHCFTRYICPGTHTNCISNSAILSN